MPSRAPNPEGKARSRLAAVVFLSLGLTLAVHPAKAQDVPVPTIAGVVNAASHLGGHVAPGEIIIITGSGLGPDTPISVPLGQSGVIGTDLGGVSVTVDGVAIPLLSVSAARINAIVPYGGTSKEGASFVVQYPGVPS